MRYLQISYKFNFDWNLKGVEPLNEAPLQFNVDLKKLTPSLAVLLPNPNN